MDKFIKFFTKKKPEAKSSDIRNLENLAPNLVNQNKNVENETQSQIEKPSIQEEIRNENTQISQMESSSDIVIVNNTILEKKNEGFYYKKYIDDIQKLKISNPILMEREKMKVNFDTEVMDYLVNDMTLIFREKQNKVDENLVN